jgi:ABC-2 type transport system ATP-binding protein
VPEEPHLYPFLSGREHLELVGRLREMPPASMDRKINALLELFGLSDAAEQGIADYSKGMKQKILVMALVAPMPGASVITATIVKTGLPTSDRQA